MLNWILDKLLKRAETLSERQRTLQDTKTPISETDRLMREGYQAHVAGNLDTAEAAYRKILFRDPSHAEALYLLGEIQATRNIYDQAVELMRKAVSNSPSTVAFHAGLANTLRQTGDIAGAEASYREAVRLEPGNSQYLNNLGTLLQEQKRLPEALECYQKALSITPDLAQALYNTAAIYRAQGQTEEASRLLDKALSYRPEHTQGFIELAELYNSAGKPAEAMNAYKQAFSRTDETDLPIEIRVQSRSNYGDLLQMQKRYTEAIAQYMLALELQPDAFAIWVNLGNAYKEEKRSQEALDSYLKALELQSQCAEAFSNIGTMLKEYGNCRQALETYRLIAGFTPDISWPPVDETARFCELPVALALIERAIHLNPDSAGFLLNKGVALEEMGRFVEAADCYDRAVALDPQSPQANFNKGISLLRLGHLEDGWPKYECRLKFGKDINEVRLKAAPLWKGEPLPNGTLLVHAEQGLGDTIQFIRYFKEVAARCKHVLFECQPAVKTLIESVPGVIDIYATGQPLPKIDFQVPLLNLPGIFGTRLDNIPAPIPYIFPETARAARWKEELAPQETLKVGIVWAGGAVHLGNRFRSCTLSTFGPLATVSGVTFYSLQKGEPEKEALTPPPGMKLVNCSPQITDFRDTAALISNLDLVITVDTSVAHLSGAMGKPTWVLIPFCPDWRWMLDRTDSPWYPTMRLFRQTGIGDWQACIDNIRTALADLAKHRQ